MLWPNFFTEWFDVERPTKTRYSQISDAPPVGPNEADRWRSPLPTCWYPRDFAVMEGDNTLQPLNFRGRYARGYSRELSISAPAPC